MARRGKYGFDKRVKELKKKKKREEKLERKRAKKQSTENDSTENQDAPTEATDEGLALEDTSADDAPEEPDD